MRLDYGRRRKLRGRCCLECCCQDRQLQADGGSFRSFGEFAEISMLLWLQGEARSAGRRCVTVVSSRGFLSTTGIDLRNLIGLGGLLRLTLAASQGGNFTRDTA